MANLITGIISLTISAVILASVFIFTVKNTSTCIGGGGVCNATYGKSWTTAELTMWGLLTLVAVVGLLYGTLNTFGIA